MVSSSQTKKVFNLHVNTNGVEGAFADMNSSLKTAAVNTLNVVGRTSNKKIAADIKANYNIKARTLRLGKTVSLRRADVRKRLPVFTISILKKGRGLALYSPIPNTTGRSRGSGGVSVQIKKGRQTIRRSFIIKNKRGMPFVVRKSRKGGFVDRVSRSGKRYKAARSEFLYGPSLAALYGRRKSLKIIGKVIDTDYKNELDKQFNNQFEKKRR